MIQLARTLWLLVIFFLPLPLQSYPTTNTSPTSSNLPARPLPASNTTHSQEVARTAAAKEQSLDEEDPSNKSIVGTGFWSGLLKMILALTALMAVMIIITLTMKQITQQRNQLMNRSSAIQILEQRHLDPKTTLYIVGSGEQQWLVASASGTFTSIGEIKAAKEQSETKSL